MTAHRLRQVKAARRVALVTGGGVRLGREIALALGRAGLDVAVAYHHSARAARATVQALTADGVDAAALRADLRSPRAAARLVAAAVARFGRLDVLVNSAARFYRTPFAATTPAEFDDLLGLNLRAPFFCAQAAARRMRRGHIVNIGDAGSGRAWPAHIPYTLSKVGVAALTRGLAAALRPRIAVNCVEPGAVLRPPRFPRGRWARLRRGSGASPAAVAAAVVFFATCPPSITGQILAVGR